MIKRIIFLAIISPIFGACQEDVFISANNFNSSMVAYAEILNDSILAVNLSKTIAPESGDDLSIPPIVDASIVLLNSKGEQVCEAKPCDDEGNYVGNFQSISDETYVLSVSSSLGLMKSERINLVKILPDQIELSISEFSLGNFNYTHKLFINIPASYFVNSPKTLSLSLSGVDKRNKETFTILPNTTPVFDFQFLCDYEFGTNNDIVFQLDDKCINASDDISLEIVFSNERILSDQKNLLADELQVNFSVYSSSYYRFISDFIRYDGIDLFFAIPGSPYSSFDNGFGYFTARGEMMKTLELYN